MRNSHQKLRTMMIHVAITMLILLVGCNNSSNGETKTFNFGGLKLEVTNVYEVRTESMKDDGGNPWEYSVFVYYPGARVTVLAADMSDVNFSADGKSHANWGVLLDSDARQEIVDDMKSFDLTSDMLGIYSLEANLYVLKFEMYKNKK